MQEFNKFVYNKKVVLSGNIIYIITGWATALTLPATRAEAETNKSEPCLPSLLKIRKIYFRIQPTQVPTNAHKSQTGLLSSPKTTTSSRKTEEGNTGDMCGKCQCNDLVYPGL